jgi:hypothetical protein
MSGMASGLTVVFLLSLCNLLLDSGTYNEKDRNEDFNSVLQAEDTSGPQAADTSGPQAAIPVSTHRFCWPLFPHGELFGYKLFWLHSHQFCQRDLFTQNSMEKSL